MALPFWMLMISSNHEKKRASSGKDFTLLEVVIALAVFALIGGLLGFLP